MEKPPPIFRGLFFYFQCQRSNVMKKYCFLSLILLISFYFKHPVFSCTNLIVTKGASKDGSVMITYAADSHTRYGALSFYPGGSHPSGTMLDVFHYENGKWLGQIPEVERTYTVIGLMNEHQVAIGETTFGGLDSLSRQPEAFLDYGSLMKIGLQRSRTARELIRVITELVAEYGYASSGESFSISDANEAWIMEIIGKGKYEKGAVWVALKIPDGYVSGHANQARIMQFPIQKTNAWIDQNQSCFHSKDVISFARDHGFYQGNDQDFSFSDTYNPVNFSGARFCDSRVWSFFRQINRSVAGNPNYTEYAEGKVRYNESYATNRMPLWVKPDQKIDRDDVMAFMRNHFEGTPLDMRDGIGAGPFHLPYRWRPMEFTIDSVMYCHERAIATQQTGYVFVAQSRSWLPDPIGGIFWFGVDDADGCVFAPMYCGIQSIPQSYAVGNGSMIKWSDNSAFWTFNQVNNWAYTRYNMIHPEVEKYQSELESGFFKETEIVDARAVVIYQENQADCRNFLTSYTVYCGDLLVSKWNDFYHYLFMKYMDGNLKQSDGRKLLDNGNGKGIPKKPSHPGYGKDWERLMMQNTGDKYREIK